MWERSWAELNDYYSNEQPHRTESHQGYLLFFKAFSHLGHYIIQSRILCAKDVVHMVNGILLSY